MCRNHFLIATIFWSIAIKEKKSISAVGVFSFDSRWVMIFYSSLIKKVWMLLPASTCLHEVIVDQSLVTVFNPGWGLDFDWIIATHWVWHVRDHCCGTWCSSAGWQTDGQTFYSKKKLPILMTQFQTSLNISSVPTLCIHFVHFFLLKIHIF